MLVFCPNICPNRCCIYDGLKPCQQWLSHFSQDRQLAQELIIGQIIQRLHLESSSGARDPLAKGGWPGVGVGIRRISATLARAAERRPPCWHAM